MLPVDLMFIGLKANRKYIQSKLPLENETLKAFTAIDPLLVRCPNKLVLKRLLSLPTLVPIVLEDDEGIHSRKRCMLYAWMEIFLVL